MESMISLPETVSVVVGVFMPILIQWIKKKVKAKQIRFLIALVLCGLTGTVAALVAGAECSWANVVEFTTIAFGMSQIVYNAVKSLFV